MSKQAFLWLVMTPSVVVGSAVVLAGVVEVSNRASGYGFPRITW